MNQDLPDLYPGFQEAEISAGNGETLYCRIGGSGPPLLLIHGYPQTHAIWHRIAPQISGEFTLVIPDLPGYGQSSIPPLSQDHFAYSKRGMAKAMVELMQALGHGRFRLAGHDRGARVAYRLAFDHPHLVEKIAVLDILPTAVYWDNMDRDFALRVYHWAFLAQPAPFPENLIAPSAIAYLEHTLASWTARKDLSCFDPAALAHYRAFFSDPARIAATCEDYRAGSMIDIDHDRADMAAGRKIQAPLLTLWADAGLARETAGPLDVWSNWAETVSGKGVDCGHFIPEEAADEAAAEMRAFFSQ